MMRAHMKELVVTFLLFSLFVVVGYFSQEYNDRLVELFGAYGMRGMLAYIAGAAVTTVIAPLSFLPAMPVAVALWGSFTAAVLSIFAWSLGAAIAFLLARRYGRPLVRHLAGEKRMDYFSSFLPKQYLFLAVVFLRMALPVDLLSYALGLFGVIRFWPYMLATIIGITPFAFAFAYLAGENVYFQIGALLLGVFFIALGFPYMRRRYRQLFIEGEEQPSDAPEHRI
jgi:uncharacterized membrane protein YdjX (TVP38/TMEM64 family)